MAIAVEPQGPQAAVPAAEWEGADRHLRKGLSFTSLLFMSVGAIIGSGWLFAALASAGVAGPAAIVAWVVAGLFVLFIAFSWMEISAMLPRSGAVVRYPFLTHGGYTGWMVGWSYFLSAVTVPAIEAEAVVTYLGGQFPKADMVSSSGVLSWPQGILVGIGLMILFTSLNYFGIRLLGLVNQYVTWWKIVIPTATFITLFLLLKGQNFTGLAAVHGSTGGFAPYGIANIFLAISTTGIIFSYLGFRQALDYGGESRRPQRDIPLATIISVGIGMVIYTLIQVAFIGAANFHNAGVAPGDWAALAKSPWSTGPLKNALDAAGIGAFTAFATLLVIDAGVSPSGTGWIYLGTAARTNYGLSVAGSIPKWFQLHNRYGIPWLALIAALVVGCVFFVPAPSWYLLVGFISSCTVLTYIMGGLSMPAMRRFAPHMHRPFVLKNYWLWAPVGFLAAMMIVYWSGFSTLVDVFAAVFVGLPLFTWYYMRNKGWINPVVAAVVGLVFTGAWVYLNKEGGWVLTSKLVPGSWSFPAYDIAFSLAVAAFCAAIWALSNAEGRKHIVRGLWFIFLCLAVFPLSYYGQFGPQASPSISFPWDTLIAVGIGLVAYGLGLLSSFETDEMRDITAAAASTGTGGGGSAAVTGHVSPAPLPGSAAS